MLPNSTERLQVANQNVRMAEYLGRTALEFGSLPLHAWIWSGELLYLGKNNSTGNYELYRQMELSELEGVDRWVTASWSHQGSPEEWKRKYGDAIAWPDKGMYISDSALWMKPGEIPTEATTQLVINIILRNRQLNRLEKKNIREDQHAKILKSQVDGISDFLDDIPDHNPGRQGQHASYPLVNYKGYKVPVIITPQTPKES